MKRRIIAAIAAILLAGVGAVVLLGYVGNADRAPWPACRRVNVFVVTAPVPEGTTAEALVKLVHSETCPPWPSPRARCPA